MGSHSVLSVLLDLCHWATHDSRSSLNQQHSNTEGNSNHWTSRLSSYFFHQPLDSLQNQFKPNSAERWRSTSTFL